jgi:predicted NUDIX family NTP pyrophosphohydrolase
MKLSAGLLFYKKQKGALFFFLVHPGGPFFTNKDTGHWTVPKGEVFEGESPAETAKREFEEETGIVPNGTLRALQPIVQKGGKKVMCWAVETSMEFNDLKSNTFDMIWPPKSGIMRSFPEIDKYGWFHMEEAKKKINIMQVPFLEEIESWYKP